MYSFFFVKKRFSASEGWGVKGLKSRLGLDGEFVVEVRGEKCGGLGGVGK